MDHVHRFNKDRWEVLVKADALYSRPWLSENKSIRAATAGPCGPSRPFERQRGSLLAGGGGQQAVAFALNGSHVSVLDISEGQLQRDIEAARHYGYLVDTFQRDMRDLSIFKSDVFDIVS